MNQNQSTKGGHLQEVGVPANFKKHRAANDESRIAVVGMGCWYPGAKTPKALWENILAKRQQFREMPDCRLPLSEYFDADPLTPDKTYGLRAALIDGYEFDWQARRIPKTTVDSTDIVHWLALDIALQTLEDAGYSASQLPSEQTGVIVGNTLTGEITRSNTMRTRWPYVRKSLVNVAKKANLPDEKIAELETEMEVYYKSVFPPITEDTLAGGLSNTIAGRICNFLDVKGGGYTVDGACASSLLAVCHAASALVSQDLDMVLAGGVDISLDTFELIGFAKTGALTPDVMRVYDQRGNGFIPGEGCGFVALKRFEDATRDKDAIYAILDGWGISSDGKGGITAPTSAGQSLALTRAYEKAGVSALDLDFIEGHGTGTKLGDTVELEGIAKTLQRFGGADAKTVGMTSLKSLIGHTKAAAGIGAFIKTVIAVNQRILPPTAGCTMPHSFFNSPEGMPLYPLTRGIIKDEKDVLRAGVSAMGFGGINTHVTLQSGDKNTKFDTKIPQKSLLASHQDTELFVFADEDPLLLRNKVENAAGFVKQLAFAELSDYSHYLTQTLPENALIRAAVTASSPEELHKKCLSLAEKLSANRLALEQFIDFPEENISIGYGVSHSKIGFLFPGQGSQQLNMARKLVERHRWAQDLLDKTTLWLEEVGVFEFSSTIFRDIERASDRDTLQEWDAELNRIAQPAIVFSSVLWIEYLRKLGVSSDVCLGHSLGELTAFYAANLFDLESLIKFAGIRGKLMNSETNANAGMVSLACGEADANELLRHFKHTLTISNINSPTQTVISGLNSELEQLVVNAKKQTINATKLSVANAFHSPYVKGAANALSKQLPIPNQAVITSGALFSSKAGAQMTGGINLHAHFLDQIVEPVQFVSAANEFLKNCDMVIEVGPNQVLSQLIQTMNVEKKAIFPVESQVGLDLDVQALLAHLFVRGHTINWQTLFENRLIRPFVPPHERQFIVNPLEKTPSEPSFQTQVKSDAKKTETTVKLPENTVEDYLVKLASERTGFTQDSINLSLRLLDDLNLDSIKAGDFVANAAKAFSVQGQFDPTVFANSTIQDVADAIHDAIQSGEKIKSASRENWVKAFEETWVSAEVKGHRQSEQPPHTSICFNEKNPLALLEQLHAFVANIDDSHRMQRLLVFYTNGHISPLSFFASIHHEYPDWHMSVIECPKNLGDLREIVLAESAQSAPFLAVKYDDAQTRYTRQYTLYEDSGAAPYQWSSEDVVLVTGGAKGITAACALALAEQTNATMILVGSSENDANTDNEINRNLAAFQEKGLTATYYACDITQKESVNALLHTIQKKHGPISALIHGAGINVPRSVGAVTKEEAIREISPKVLGLQHLLECMDPTKLSAIVGMSSIIGHTGMPGNAWYAFSNETMNHLIAQYGEAHPAVHTQILSYSIWDDIGMGVKMGSVQQLENLGISAIPMAQGVDSFINFVCQHSSAGPAIICSRLGGLDTWQRAPHKKPNAQRFLDTLIAMEPGVELVVRAHLSLETDLYLKDHNFRGSYLFPTVFGLEAMAQAVAWVTERESLIPLTIRNVSLEKPISVDPDKGTTIEIRAYVESKTIIKAEIFTESSDFRSPHFSAEFVLEAPAPVEKAEWDIPNNPLDIDPKDLYGWLLFQGPLFQRIHTIHSLDEKQACLEIDPEEPPIWVNGLPNDLILGNPFVRDCLLQSVQLSIPKDLCLPAFIEQIKLRAVDPRPTSLILSRIERLNNRVYHCNVIANEGEALIGYKLRIIESSPDHPEPADLSALDSFCENRVQKHIDAYLNDLIPNTPKVSLFRYKNLIEHEKAIRHELEKPFLKRAVSKYLKSVNKQDENWDVSWLSNGRPNVTNFDAFNLGLSLSHTDSYCLSLAGEENIGIDIEMVDGNPKNWDSLLPETSNELYVRLLENGFTENAAGHLCWTAYESALKATNHKGGDFKLVDAFSSKERVLLETSSGISVYCFFLDLLSSTSCISIAFSSRKTNLISHVGRREEVASPRETEIYSYSEIGPQGQDMFAHRFRALFQDARTYNKKVCYSSFGSWMGMIRELPLVPISNELVEQLETGSWGLATNSSSIEVIKVIRAFDIVEGRIWISGIDGQYNSRLHLNYDWLVLNKNCELERVAQSSMIVTWVKILEDGHIEVYPFPDYINNLMITMVSEKSSDFSYNPPMEKFVAPDKGQVIYNNNSLPAEKNILYKKRYETTMADSNIVGNVYFSNYYSWQAKIKDEMLYRLCPELYSTRCKGELRVVSSEIINLRELMPFETVEVNIALGSISDRQIELKNTFFSVSDKTDRMKLAYGKQTLIWVGKDTDKSNREVIPEYIINLILEASSEITTTQMG